VPPPPRKTRREGFFTRSFRSEGCRFARASRPRLRLVAHMYVGVPIPDKRGLQRTQRGDFVIPGQQGPLCDLQLLDRMRAYACARIFQAREPLVIAFGRRLTEASLCPPDLAGDRQRLARDAKTEEGCGHHDGLSGQRRRPALAARGECAHNPLLAAGQLGQGKQREGRPSGCAQQTRPPCQACEGPGISRKQPCWGPPPSVRGAE